MFIQTENTPNPRTLKFLPGREVMPTGSASFSDKEAAEASPLAEALFGLNHVEGLFFGSDFVTVTKADAVGWEVLKPHVLTTIMEHFVAGRPILASDTKKTVKKASTEEENDSDLVKQIKELIDTRVRPAVAEDGGDIVFCGFADGTVFLELHGACSGCPSSTMTLKNGIENMLKHYVPEVQRVEAIS
jgi:Fe-S cluster biogenesis protein NfuA